ncbi:MAG: aspartate/glutamate racemase family protein [Gammaproteobacteria bacterium]|nr:aspartate/glutamate racemase family protein [Gammaproteobacteria bacterium]
MKTIGMIGGMSWQSSLEYYRLINENVQRQLGGHNNAKSLMASVNFGEVEAMMQDDDWPAIREELGNAARQLQDGGADLVILCTNTMHKLADDIAAGINIPLLNIIDATAREIHAAKLSRVGLLGTRFTMRDEFFVERLAKHGIETVLPEKLDQFEVDRIIFEELTQGIVENDSRNDYLRVIDRLKGEGAQGVILGCTEIGMLLKQRDCALPLFDTTRIHARAAVRAALGRTA